MSTTTSSRGRERGHRSQRRRVTAAGPGARHWDQLGPGEQRELSIQALRAQPSRQWTPDSTRQGDGVVDSG